ncbi:hypothetical protein ACJIZ3_011528 [Penstemon smallii]|uniref:RNA helicase n=1 Tax=Penstemon smallii TaxID=265156 RepID=A0ABD3ULK0_9LAMI
MGSLLRRSSLLTKRTLTHRVGVYNFQDRSSTYFSKVFSSIGSGELGISQDADEGLDISKLGISQEIVSALDRRGILELFPIQRAVLKPALQGRDMICRDRHGTGKKLAFGIPIMEKVIQFQELHGRAKYPSAIIMAPTREIAQQVEKEFVESAPKVATMCAYGGVPIHHQISTLSRGVDVLVGTPGRVMQLIKRGALNLTEVKFVVLDEADQLLNFGSSNAVETILGCITQKHQTMMFSATMPTRHTQTFLNDPVIVDLVGDQKLAAGITFYSITSEKLAIIEPLIKEHAKGGKCIIFTQTKRDADRLAYGMERSFKCEALHGGVPHNERERTLSSFRDGQIQILVATDIAAHGLDVPNVNLVIHYGLPNSSEIFVHRTGRIGPAGKEGTAILIHSALHQREVRAIERDVGCQFVELKPIGAGDSGSGDFARILRVYAIIKKTMKDLLINYNIIVICTTMYLEWSGSSNPDRKITSNDFDGLTIDKSNNFPEKRRKERKITGNDFYGLTHLG